MIQFVNELMRDESGATAVEYGLIVALISIAGMMGYEPLGDVLSKVFNTLSGEMNDASSDLTGGGATSTN